MGRRRRPRLDCDHNDCEDEATIDIRFQSDYDAAWKHKRQLRTPARYCGQHAAIVTRAFNVATIEPYDALAA